NSRLTAEFSEVTDEIFLLETVDPFILEPRLFLCPEGFFDVGTDFVERSKMSGSLVLDEHEVAGFGRVDHVAHLSDRQSAGRVREFLAQDGKFDPVEITLARL